MSKSHGAIDTSTSQTRETLVKTFYLSPPFAVINHSQDLSILRPDFRIM